jgi:hypothetical protein
MKRIVLNRKNSVFVGNARGGRTAAILANLTSTCRRNRSYCEWHRAGDRRLESQSAYQCQSRNSEGEGNSTSKDRRKRPNGFPACIRISTSANRSSEPVTCKPFFAENLPLAHFWLKLTEQKNAITTNIKRSTKPMKGYRSKTSWKHLTARRKAANTTMTNQPAR